LGALQKFVLHDKRGNRQIKLLWLLHHREMTHAGPKLKIDIRSELYVSVFYAAGQSGGGSISARTGTFILSSPQTFGSAMPVIAPLWCSLFLGGLK